MARTARRQSESGVYHVMVRGVNRQPIFECREDYLKFIDVLAECKELAGFELFAYCLMENHFHLLVRPSAEEPLATVFRRIGGRYVVWFNRKYERAGHLFQDRFRSEAIDGDAYFLSCARYILQNPVKAGICSSPEEYEFSSMREYVARSSGLTDTGLLLGMVGSSAVVDFLSAEPTERHIDYDRTGRLGDAEAKLVMEEVCGCCSAAEFQTLDKGHRDAALAEMGERGVSIRQAARIAGVGVGIVRRCYKLRG